MAREKLERLRERAIERRERFSASDEVVGMDPMDEIARQVMPFQRLSAPEYEEGVEID